MRSLRFQLLVSHLILVLLMGIVMSYAITTFFQLGTSIDRVMTGNFKGALAAQEMQHGLARQTGAMNLMLSGHIDEAQREFSVSWPDLVNAYNAAATETDPRQQTALKEMLTQMGAYHKVAEDTLFTHIPSTTVQAEERYTQVIRPLLQLMDEDTRFLVVINQGEIMKANNKVKDEARRAAFGSVGLTAVALVLAVLLAYGVVRFALQPLASMAEQAESIGSGDLTHRIEIDRDDEIGALATSFNSMAANLQDLRRSEERRLHRAERMADVALEFLYDPVIVTDAKGRIVFLNKAAEGLFGPTPATPRTPIVEHIGDRRIVRAIENAVKEDRVSANEDETALVPIKVGETERTYRLRANPMKDDEGATLGCVAVLEDISHLRELDRLKNEFIGVASHELRTPVTSLMLSVQLLQEGAAGELTPIQKEIIGAQQEDLDRLEKLMRELLDVTRLEAGTSPPRFELISPYDLVRQSVESVKAKAEAKGVHLEQVEDLGLRSVRADRSQISRVLVNLLDNAIRHTPSGGGVKIRALASNNHVTFRVEDTGEGIPEDYLARIFDRFVQVPGATQGGAGLGLSIVQTIVKAHGGEMKVESELHKGSAFSFDLNTDSTVAGDISI